MSGVLVIGASRSGTSMTAGLFERHGVFFGDCMRPSRANAKGYFENLWLKRVYKGQVRTDDFPSAWRERREREGWQGGPWGAKCGAERWDQYWRYVPDIVAIVQCYRERRHIEASRSRVGFNPSRQTVDFNWRIMDRMRAQGWPCFQVWPAQFVRGDFSALLPAFEALGVAFDRAIAADFVEPRLWHEH